MHRACVWFRGWNITIVGAALYTLADGMRLSRRKAFWAILFTIWLYTLFVGATPTVIRAAVRYGGGGRLAADHFSLGT